MAGRARTEPLKIGQKVRDREGDAVGEIVDCASQFAHPKAAPVYTYLIRWSDGQVQAVTEAAFGGAQGLEAVD